MDVVPVLLFLLALATVYVGSIETAFTLLMRLSLRFVADRGGPEDRLARYLDDPVKFFVPIRLLLGVLFACATILLAILIGRGGWRSIAALILSVAVFSLVCEHLLPTLMVRRDPQKVLEILLPSFDRMARWLRIRRIAAVIRRPRAARDRRRAARGASRRAAGPARGRAGSGEAETRPPTRRSSSAMSASSFGRSSTSATRSCAKS